MSEKNISIIPYQTFYASKENSNSPFIPEIVRAGKKLKESDIATDAIISLSYGRRILVNAENIDIGKIRREDLLEIVDFDPVKRVLLVMGSKESDIDSLVQKRAMPMEVHQVS